MERGAKSVRVVGLIAKQAARLRAADKPLCSLIVVPLALGDLERKWEPEGVNDQVDLRRKTST